MLSRFPLPGTGISLLKACLCRLLVPFGEILIAIRWFAKTEVSSPIFLMLIFQHVILIGSSFFQVFAMTEFLN
jgi:hypothetical protein